VSAARSVPPPRRGSRRSRRRDLGLDGLPSTEEVGQGSRWQRKSLGRKNLTTRNRPASISRLAREQVPEQQLATMSHAGSVENAQIAPPSDPYQGAWTGYRRDRKWAWIALALFFPAAVSVGLLAQRLGLPPLCGVALPLAAAAALLGRAATFRCPRCGNFFHHTYGSHNPLARKCLHCGLPAGKSLLKTSPPIE
jgi:hypothetical protein